MKKLITNIFMDKFILVVEKNNVGDKNKYDIIYAIDDEDVLWIHRKGGVSHRFATITQDTFFDSIEKAQAGLEYLRGCFFTFYPQIKIVALSDLKSKCELTYNMLINDISEYNESVSRQMAREHKETTERLERVRVLHEQLRSGTILDYERDLNADDDDDTYIVTIKIKR